MSKYNYLFQCTAVPDQILNKLESLLFKFLWNDKNNKIKRKKKQLMEKLHIWQFKNGRHKNTAKIFSDKLG